MRNSKGIAWVLMLILGASGAMWLWRFLQNYGVYLLAALGGFAFVMCLPSIYRYVCMALPRVRDRGSVPRRDSRFHVASNPAGRNTLAPTQTFENAIPVGRLTTTPDARRAARANSGSKLVIALWNVQWASRGNTKGKFFVPLLRNLDCDVLCITEGSADVLPECGHTITCGADYGYGVQKSKRKVILWSRNPWREVDEVGSASLPPGRFIAGTTETRFGFVRFIGVCIPWRDAHVSSGQRNRSPWEDHLTYCRHLPEASASRGVAGTVLLGDFNQRIPRQRQPVQVYSALLNALGSGFTLATAGTILGAPGPAIDHLAMTGDLSSADVTYMNPEDDFGKAMSDHFGLKVTLMRA